MSHLEETTCNLCGSGRWKRLHRKFELDIVQCRDCGLVYAGPVRLTREASWLRYNPDYFHQEYLPALGVVDGQFDLTLFDKRYKVLLNLFRSYRQKKTLLEVGCGAGFFLKAAERAGWNTEGLEVSEAAVTFAQEQLNLRVQCAVLEETSFAENSFDVVTMFDTIEHLFDPMHILRLVHRILRPGGALFISTPNINALSHYALGKPWAVLSPAEHLYYFSPKTLNHMLQKTEYENIIFGRFSGIQGIYETMSPQHNQDPTALRSRLYTSFVDRFGAKVFRMVQALGMGDGLYFLAEKPSR